MINPCIVVPQDLLFCHPAWILFAEEPVTGLLALRSLFAEKAVRHESGLDWGGFLCLLERERERENS
jgi:hypothetical protein